MYVQIILVSQAPLAYRYSKGMLADQRCTRKIDEPKTPFVRYDEENDVVLGGEPIHLLLLNLMTLEQMFLLSTFVIEMSYALLQVRGVQAPMGEALSPF